MKRHETDLVSLVFALVFLFVAALWPLWRLGALDQGTVSWLPATALIAIGVLGLTLSVNASRRPAYGSDPAYDSNPEYDSDTERPADEQDQPR